MKIFFLILSQKKILVRIIISCNNIFDTNILSRGYSAKLKNYGNSRGGGGGSKVKVPSVRGGEGMDIFWNYTLPVRILIHVSPQAEQLWIDFQLHMNNKSKASQIVV